MSSTVAAAYTYRPLKRDIAAVDGYHHGFSDDHGPGLIHRTGSGTRPSEHRPRKRSSTETEASRIRSNTAVQAWELYQQLRINAKAGIKKPGTAGRPSGPPAPAVSWQREEREDNCPAPCHGLTATGRMYKPNISHLEMIRLVLAASLEKQLHLEDIYAAIEARWPWFKDNKTNWKASIRHNLSRHECFMSTPDADGYGNRARGGLWSLCEF